MSGICKVFILMDYIYLLPLRSKQRFQDSFCSFVFFFIYIYIYTNNNIFISSMWFLFSTFLNLVWFHILSPPNVIAHN